ncbi:MAG: hypothetical protein ACYS1C_07590, partial [Planctomycetota bacterium]
CLDNRGRFLPKFEELVRALCAEPTWVMPAHDKDLANFEEKRIDIDLASSALAWDLATADYLLGDCLSAQARRLLRENVRRRVLEPFRDMVSGTRPPNQWLSRTNNWNAVCLAGVTGAALVQVESPRERAAFVVAAETYSENFLSGFGPDGYCTEGVGYWNYGLGHYVLLAEAVYQATGGELDLLDREGVAGPAAYGSRIEIANGAYPAFADCHVGVRASPRILWFVGRRLGVGMPECDEAELVSPEGHLAEAMMYSFPSSASRPGAMRGAAAGLEPRAWFHESGVLICRPGTKSACRLAVALKGGHNDEHHNHNDVGSYVVVAGERAVLLDPGPEQYSARTFGPHRYESEILNSYGHPVPVVARQLQSTGRQACGRVIRTEFTGLADTLVLDLSAAYEVPGLRKLQRTFTYCREGAGSLTVTDEVAFDRPEQFGTALITLGGWEELDSGSLLVSDGEEAVRIDVEVAGGRFDIESEQIPLGVKPTRLGINLRRPVRQATVRVVITPLAAD